MTTTATLAAQLRTIRDELIEARRYLADHEGTKRRINVVINQLSAIINQIEHETYNESVLCRLCDNLDQGLAKWSVLPTLLPNYIDAAVGELGWLASSLERVAETGRITEEQE